VLVVIFPIAPSLLREYTVQHAAGSVRRQQVDSIVRKMIEEQPRPNQMTFVTTRPRAGSASAS
jgi:hypothetical protein